MNLTDINEIKKEGLNVFMPSGIQATLFKEGEDIIVQYPNLHKDKYTNEAFNKIIDEGIFIFSEQPTIPQQSALMESREVIYYVCLDGEQVSPEFSSDIEATRWAEQHYDIDDDRVSIEMEEFFEDEEEFEHDEIDWEDDMDESVLDMLHKKGYIRESLIEGWTDFSNEKSLDFLGIDENDFSSKKELIKYIEENTDYDVLGSGDYWLNIIDKTKNDGKEIKINLEHKLGEAFENTKRKEGDVFKGLKSKKKEYITPEFKLEMLNCLDRIAIQHSDVKIRQQALTFMDEINLQEYWDIKAVKDFCKKHLEVLDQHVNESLNEEEDEKYFYGTVSDGTRLLVKAKDSEEAINKLGNEFFCPELKFDSIEDCDKQYDEIIDESLNEEELVMNANLENIANEIASGNKEGFEPNEFGNWYLMTSLDQKWNSITDFMKQTILENISEYILKGEVSKDNIELGFNDAYEQEDLESLDMFSDEDIEELLLGDTHMLTAEISYELKFDNQIDNLGESFKLKQKKKTKKKLDEKSRGINMKKLKECCYKVYNSIEGKDCGVFNSWNEVEAFLDKEYGNYATEFKSENPDYIGTCNKDEFLANYELDIIQEPNPEKVSNVEVKSIVRSEVTNDKAEMTKNTQIVPIEQIEEPQVCDNCPNCGCNPCECEKEITEDVDLDELGGEALTVDNVEQHNLQKDDPNEEKDKIETPQDAENAIEKLDDLVDDLEDYIKSLTDDVELDQEELDEMCMQGPRDPKKSVKYDVEDEKDKEKEEQKNEEFKDNMGMLTDINDLDFPDALQNAVDTKEDGSLFRIADIAKMVQDLKSEMDTLKTDIKDMLSELKQGIKDEVKDIQNDVNSKLDNTDSKISDLTSDEEAEEDIEFMDEEPEETEESQSEEEQNTKDKQKEEQVEESMLDEEALKGNPVWEAMQEIMKENKHPKGYMSIVTMSEKLREDYGINTKIQSNYNTVSNLCLHTSIKEHIVDVETEKESLKESLLGKATKWLSKGLMGKCTELKEAEQREELNKVKAEIDKLHNENKDNKIKDTIALMADDEKEAEEAINYALDKVQENKVNSLKETLLKTSNSAKLNTIRFGE